MRLRPVRKEDAAFIVWLRNLDHAKGRIGDSAIEVTSQEAWLTKYFDRPQDYYFLIETLGGRPVGTYGLWDFTDNSAESGRWIIRTDVPAAIPSAVLGLDIAFTTLGLSKLRVKTVSTNLPVLSLNRKFGMRQTIIETDSTVIGGQSVDQIHFVLYPRDWAQARQRLLPLAKIAEQQIRDWEKAENQGPQPGPETTACSLRVNQTTPVSSQATAVCANPSIQL
ncbi:MAG TPA: GNAT family protein [Bacillota bacterium]|nr:GNAT family protein [Bacillota bacterium]